MAEFAKENLSGYEAELQITRSPIHISPLPINSAGGLKQVTIFQLQSPQSHLQNGHNTTYLAYSDGNNNTCVSALMLKAQ